MARYSKADIIDRLRQFEEDLGHSPTQEVWDGSGRSPHSCTIYRKFGSWNKALKSANLLVNHAEAQPPQNCCCTQCGEHFRRHVSQIKQVENLFCSQSCAAIYNNSHGKTGRCGPRPGHKNIGLGTASTTKYGRVDSGIVITPSFCLGCGDQITSREQARYCSQTCCQRYRSLIKTSLALSAPNSVGKSTLKRVVIEARGRKCEICDRSSWNGKKIALDLDHIDGNPRNNAFENLRVLCPNCHAQTPTYKGKNVGNGRHYRRQRYAEGKSY